MSEEHTNFDGYEVDNPAPEQDKSLAVMGNIGLEAWTGGVDYQGQIAYLPERITWDKKEGLWSSETTGEGGKIRAKLVAATTIWAKWSEQIGSPEDMAVGVRPDGPGYDMGIRLIVEVDDFLYYWDAFGIAFKSAQSAVRRAQKMNREFCFDGKKSISTKFGQFYIPTLEKIDEGR